jgi:hypothetical protein
MTKNCTCKQTQSQMNNNDKPRRLQLPKQPPLHIQAAKQ